MFKVLAAFIGATALGCSLQTEEPIASEELTLPVTATAPCVRVTCDQATCPGALTVTQTVPMGIGRVEVWDASQWGSSGAIFNGVPTTTVTQSPGSVVTRTTGLVNFSQGQTFCLLTGVVTRNAAGNVVGSAPVLNNGQLALQPSAVTATVAP